MTQEEIDLSRIKIAGPPKGWKSEQGDMCNFDWMVYQIKSLESILGNKETADWINRPTDYLLGKSPAEISIGAPGDKGCAIIGNFIASTIKGEIPDLETMPELKRAIMRAAVNMPRRKANQDAIRKFLEASIVGTNGPEEGADEFMEMVITMALSVHDTCWDMMMAVLNNACRNRPTPVMQASELVMQSINALRRIVRDNKCCYTIGNVTFIY